MKRPPVIAHRNFQRVKDQLRPQALKDKFTYIFQSNMWACKESNSGLGSAPDATFAVRRAMEQVCHDYGIRSLLDLPCGDVSWIQFAKLPIKQYLGGDIVPEIIDRNRGRDDLRQLNYSVRFEVLDLTSDELPKSNLLLCRDCLVHLSFDNIQLALKNIAKSGCEYLLTTTFHEHDENEDIEDGDWRLLNLERAPFSFPAPLAMYNEACDEEDGAYADKSLALWKVSELGSMLHESAENE